MAKMEVQNFIQNGYRYTSTVHVVLKMLLEVGSVTSMWHLFIIIS